MQPKPLLFSDPMPGDDHEKHENGENGEDGENTEEQGEVQNPWYDPGFEKLADDQTKTGDQLVDQTVHQDDVVTQNFFKQSGHNLSVAEQRGTIEANYGESSIIEAGRDDDPSVADAVKSVSSVEGDPIAKTQAFDSLATRKAMYTDVLGDQVERGKVTSKEEAAKASSELGSIIEAGTSALNTSGDPETADTTLVKKHLKHTLDEAAEIKDGIDAKLAAKPDGGETEDGAVDVADDEAETETIEDAETETPETTETPTTDTAEGYLPVAGAETPAEQKTDAPETEYATPVFLSYDDQRRDDPSEVIYGAMAASPEETQKKKPAEGEEGEQ